MFGRKRQEHFELVQFLIALRNEVQKTNAALDRLAEGHKKGMQTLSEDLLASFDARCQALREEITRNEQPAEQKKEPEALSGTELMNKWIMGEHGDGI